MATRLVKSDTIAAVRTIQTILESVDDHGVVDVIKKYPLQDLIASLYALSRLQAATEFWYRQTSEPSVGGYSPVEEFPVVNDEGLLEELNHYAPFASATYGWKLDLATAGRLHRGDLHALTRITKIPPEDVVKVEWESRPHRPVRVPTSYHHQEANVSHELISFTVTTHVGILHCSRSQTKKYCFGDTRNMERS